METILANEILKAQNAILKRISKDFNIPLSTLTGKKPKKLPPVKHNHLPEEIDDTCKVCAQYGNPFNASVIQLEICN